MSNYTIIIDRGSEYLKRVGNVFHLPFSQTGELWDEITHPLKHFSNVDFDNRTLDFIDIATAIYHADKLCLRDERESWIRTITIRAALREPDSFGTVINDLKHCLAILGGDNFNFEIEATPYADDYEVEEVEYTINTTRPFTSICLLSGGQDSFVGASEILEEGGNPLLLRIHSSDRSNLRNVKSSLESFFGLELKMFTQRVTALKLNGTVVLEKEKSQRLRSFYFLSMASIFAKEYNIQRIVINENGIMAIHLPLDVARSSTFSTRTAYPSYLALFQRTVSHILNHQFSIDNPSVFRTKTEVVMKAIEIGNEDTFRHTVSCAHSGTIQQTVKRSHSKPHLMAATAPNFHCGYCFPCLLRRISMTISGQTYNDVEYATDPFKVFVDGDSDNFDFIYEASSAVLGLLRFISKIRDSSNEELYSIYPQILESSIILNDNSFEEIVNFHHRFVGEVEEFLHENAPYLEFLLDSRRSNDVAQQVEQLMSSQFLDGILTQLGITETTHGFYKRYEKIIWIYRMRLQVAIANNQMTIQQIRNQLSRSIRDNLPTGQNSRKLVASDATVIKKALWDDLRSRPCPPFWR